MAKDADSLSRQGRYVAVVIALTMLIWMGAQLVGGLYAMPPRAAFVIDFVAFAAFAWALVASVRIWRRRRDE